MNERSGASLPRRSSNGWSPWFFAVIACAGLIAMFIFFPQRAFTVRDESNYVGVALALAKEKSLDVVDPESLDGLVPWVTIKNGHRIPQHPLGISFLAAPLAGVFGWKSCYVLGFGIWLIGAYLFARLLERERLPAAYTVLYLLFPPLLLYSRFYMTDVPSAVLCLAALYALRIPEPEGDPVTRGFSDRRRAVLGMSALGLAFLVRQTNAIFIAPLAFVALRQAIRRRERGLAIALIAMGAVFLGIHLALNDYYLGTAFASSYDLARVGDEGSGLPPRFSLQNAAHNLPFYLVSLLTVYPLLLFALGRAWRERRFVESICVTGGIAFYAVYHFTDRDANPLLSLVRGQRFLLPYSAILLLFYAKMLHERRFFRLLITRAPVVYVILAVAGIFGAAYAQTRFTRESVAAQKWAYEHTDGADTELILENVDSAEFLHGAFAPRNYRMIRSGSQFEEAFDRAAPSFERILVVETDHRYRRGERFAQPLAEAGGRGGFEVRTVHSVGPTTFVLLERPR